MVGLDTHRAKYPSQLSGGMKQRLGFARALSIKPDTLLLDEPLGSLDDASLQLPCSKTSISTSAVVLVATWTGTVPFRSITGWRRRLSRSVPDGIQDPRKLGLSDARHQLLGLDAMMRRDMAHWSCWLFAVLEFIPRSGNTVVFFPPFSDVALAMGNGIADCTLLFHAGASIWRALLGSCAPAGHGGVVLGRYHACIN
ncbi:MAG: ATP-binding cassette domain-containing protein [Flavobacteriales bacterium]|nr:ATP-binding cassette domain-containing protein [Flavobacteriales bacterium]